MMSPEESLALLLCERALAWAVHRCIVVLCRAEHALGLHLGTAVLSDRMWLEDDSRGLDSNNCPHVKSLFLRGYF